jgi:hypothetical protein
MANKDAMYHFKHAWPYKPTDRPVSHVCPMSSLAATAVRKQASWLTDNSPPSAGWFTRRRPRIIMSNYIHTIFWRWKRNLASLCTLQHTPFSLLLHVTSPATLAMSCRSVSPGGGKPISTSSATQLSPHVLYQGMYPISFFFIVKLLRSLLLLIRASSESNVLVTCLGSEATLYFPLVTQQK